MMRWIVGSSLKFHLVVLAVAVALMVVGIERLRSMPVDTLPEFVPTTVEVQTEALGLSATEVEQLITVPMEQDLLNGVAWLDHIRSQSMTGLSAIQLVFEPGTDPLRARQVVQERLTQAFALPSVSKPPQMLQPLSSTSRFMMIRLASKSISPIEMSLLAHWTLKPRLLGVPGVANVAIWGERDRQLQVQVDPKQLQDKGVTLFQVIETAGNALWVSPLTFLEANTPGVGGFIDTPNQRLSIYHLLPVTTANDLAQVVIDGKPLRLGDVATVVEDHQPLIGDDVSADGQGLMLVVEKFPDTNTLDVTRGVDAALAELQPGLTGLEMDTTVYRSASFIELAIDNLTWLLLIGAVLLLLVFAAFFFAWRSALIAGVAISLSLVAAGLVLYMRDAPFNLLLLAGLIAALAIVIDDVVIGIDNIVRRLRQHRRDGGTTSPSAVILDATLEVRIPIVFATLIILATAAPLLFLDGLTRSFSRPLVLAYVLAVLASMLVALTVTPALSLLLLSRTPLERRESPLVRWLQRGYGPMLSRLIHRPRLAFAIVGVVVVAGLAMATGFTVLPQRGGLPDLRDRDVLIRWEGAPGTSLTEMNRITGRVTSELRSVPGVRNVGAHLGRAIMSDQVANVNAGEVWVSIDPDADYGATLATIRETVAGYPGIDHDLQTYPAMRLDAAQTESGKDIVVRVYGEDEAILQGKVEEIWKLVGKTDGVVDAQIERQAEEAQLEVEVDLAAAQRFGLKPGDVRRAAATLMAGIEVGSLFEEQKVFSVVVWSKPEVRHSINDIEQLLLDTPGGDQVRLGQVATVRLAPIPNLIKHDNVRRYIDVTANVRGRALGAVARDVDHAVQTLPFPLEYHAEVLGEFAERQDNRRTLLGIGIAAAFGVFLLLQACFGSWRLAGLVFLTLPSALVGGVLAALASGGILSLGSLVGFLTVLGIAGRNGIMLLSHYQHLERVEGEPFGPGLVLRGARERLAPILMTALATALALVPLVIAGSVPGNEIEQPMALVILGGLVTSTLLNLFVVPALYLRFAPSPQTEKTAERLSAGPSISPAPASD